MKTNNNLIKCDFCGRFIAHKELEEGGRARLDFTPDTEFTCEYSGWICPRCAKNEEEFYLNGNKN